MADQPIGVTFMPSQENQPLGARQGPAEGDLAQAYKILSLQLPRTPGPAAIAPPSLLQSQGAAGVPGQQGGYNPYAALFEALLKHSLGVPTAGTMPVPGAPPMPMGPGPTAGPMPVPQAPPMRRGPAPSLPTPAPWQPQVKITPGGDDTQRMPTPAPSPALDETANRALLRPGYQPPVLGRGRSRY